MISGQMMKDWSECWTSSFAMKYREQKYLPWKKKVYELQLEVLTIQLGNCEIVVATDNE